MPAPEHPGPAPLEHCRTGIDGLDSITSGGLPRGRTTLVAGGAGSGKTLLATEFLVRGVEQGEAGVFLAFEGTAEELSVNVASLGWDLTAMCRRSGGRRGHPRRPVDARVRPLSREVPPVALLPAHRCW